MQKSTQVKISVQTKQIQLSAHRLNSRQYYRLMLKSQSISEHAVSKKQVSEQCVWGKTPTCPLTDLWYNGVRIFFLPPAARGVWQETEAERGIGWLKVEGREAATVGAADSGYTLSIFIGALMVEGH